MAPGGSIPKRQYATEAPISMPACDTLSGKPVKLGSRRLREQCPVFFFFFLTIHSADMWLKYGWADGKPCFLHPMVVCISRLVNEKHDTQVQIGIALSYFVHKL